MELARAALQQDGCRPGRPLRLRQVGSPGARGVVLQPSAREDWMSYPARVRRAKLPAPRSAGATHSSHRTCCLKGRIAGIGDNTPKVYWEREKTQGREAPLILAGAGHIERKSPRIRRSCSRRRRSG
jgi:hypothetical protein